MDTLCRVCIDKVTKCTSLNTAIDNSTKLTFLDFLNKCTSINACESDNLPQSLCSICTDSIKTFYSLVKLAEKSDRIFREALKNSISARRSNHDNESSCVDIIRRDWEIEEESENSNEGTLKNDQTSKNSSESSFFSLDIVKEEPQISETTPIFDFKDGDINDSHKFRSNHQPEESIESDEILSCTDGDLASIDADLLKKVVNNQDVTNSQKTKIGNENHITRRGSIIRVSSEAEEYTLKPNFVLNNIENTSYRCIECDKVFNNREEFRTHFRSRIIGGGYECHVCGKKFKNFSILWDHLRIHYGERPYVCEICGESFGHNSNRRKHIMKMHSGHYFICKTCGKRFCLKSNYVAHLQNHKIRYKCRYCGKVYKTKKYLLSHINAQKYKCGICSEIFCSKQTFKYHMMNKHNYKTIVTSERTNLITTV